MSLNKKEGPKGWWVTVGGNRNRWEKWLKTNTVTHRTNHFFYLLLNGFKNLSWLNLSLLWDQLHKVVRVKIGGNT